MSYYNLIASGRKTGISLDQVQERKSYIVSMKLAGFTPKTILQQVNYLNESKGWGEICLRTIQSTLANHFRMHPLNPYQAKQLDEGMREAAYAQQEAIIEKASIFINNKKDWKTGEYVNALKKLFLMHQQMIENKNWNATKAKERKGENEANRYSQLDIYNSAPIPITETQKVLNEVAEVLGELIENADFNNEYK